MKTLKKIINFLLLNILWVVCSIPLVTIGASTCAAFYVSLKMVNEEEVSVVKMFFKAFKQDFVQGTIMLCITSPCAALCFFMWRTLIKSGEMNLLFILGAFIVTLVLIILNFYSYALIARYTNSIKNTIRNSAGLTVQHFKTTMLTIVVVAAEIAIMFVIPIVTLLGLFFIPELVIFTISKTAKPIFDEIENPPPAPQPEEDVEEESLDDDAESEDEESEDAGEETDSE